MVISSILQKQHSLYIYISTDGKMDFSVSYASTDVWLPMFQVW